MKTNKTPNASQHTMEEIILCSNCFNDHGLRLDSFKIGVKNDSICPNCSSTDGRKLNKELVASLAHCFFVRGSLHRTKYGGAPTIQFNEHQKSSISVPSWLESDVRLIENAIGVGFFRYAPRMWMIGEVEPLKALKQPESRDEIIERILSEYPSRKLSNGDLFYRLRIDPKRPSDYSEYDSPPFSNNNNGRFNSINIPVMYTSQDLEVCVHECRATVEDELFVATLTPKHQLKILDLAELLEEDTTEFESLDMAIHMLFLAGDYSYEISCDIARKARNNGFDGIAFPSYFSLVRTGAMPFDTVYGTSIRKFPPLKQQAQAQTIRNLALFGRPIKDGDVEVACINRVILKQVVYDIYLGPSDY